MVGLPRSTGCRKCRRDKKSCDKVKPVCGLCQRLGYDCVYEKKEFTFVGGTKHQNVGGRRTRAKREAGEGSSRETGAVTASSESASSSSGGSPSSVGAGRVVPADEGVFEERPPLQLTLDRASTELQIGEIFWKYYLPSHRSSATIGEQFGSKTVLHTARELAPSDPLVRVTLLACAFVSVGRLVDDDRLVRQGMQRYVQTLHIINRALNEPSRARSDSVLTSCRLVAFYEMFRGGEANPMQAAAWRNHVDGMCRIIQLRGSRQHDRGFGLDVFRESRMLAVRASINRRSPSVFQNDEWLTRPWRTEDRSLRDELMDLLTRLTGFMHRHSAMAQELDSAVAGADLALKATGFLNECVRFAMQLQQWEVRVVRFCGAREPGGAAAADKNETTLLNLSRRHGYYFFAAVNEFWGTCLLHHTQMRITWSRLARAFPSRIPGAPSWIDPRPFAANIVQSAPFFFTDQAGLWSVEHAALPIASAWHFYAAFDREAAAREVLQKLFEENRYAGLLFRFVQGMSGKTTPRHPQGASVGGEEHRKMVVSFYGEREEEEEES